MLRLLFLLGMAACMEMQAAAQTTYGWEQASYPGYVSEYTPLSLFVAPVLLPACDALQKRDLAKAEQIFAAETRQHPNNLAAWLGLLQAARDHRDQWMPKFMTEVRTSPTATNHFKLGLLSWYQYVEKSFAASPKADPNMSLKERQQRRDTARENLEAAYRMTHAPVAGFSLAASCDDLRGHATPIYEDMLQRLGGTGVYQTYLRAKQNDWQGEQPPIPKLPRNDLLIMDRMAAFLRSQNSLRYHIMKQHIVNGHETTIDEGPEPYTPVQVQARAYLDIWRTRLKAAANALPQQASASVAP